MPRLGVGGLRALVSQRLLGAEEVLELLPDIADPDGALLSRHGPRCSELALSCEVEDRPCVLLPVEPNQLHQR